MDKIVICTAELQGKNIQKSIEKKIFVLGIAADS